MADRLEQFKNKGRNADTMRRGRREANVSLRKDKRNEQLLKRRLVRDETSSGPAPLGESQAANKAASGATLSNLPQIVEGIFQGDAETQFTCTRQCRMLLSREVNPPVAEVISAGLVPPLVAFLARDDQPRLQFEATWALTNIASGTSDQTMTVVSCGALPRFIALLHSQDTEVREQAVWALGNIAGDGPKLRDDTIAAGLMQALLYLANPEISGLSMLRNVTWAISNLCRGKSPQPDFAVVSQAIPTLVALLGSSDNEILADAAWALSYLTDGANFKIQAVLDAGAMPRLVELLGHPQASVQTPVLRAIGNTVSGDDSQTDAVVSLNALPAFVRLLNSPKENIRKEACWSLSNITAGTATQIQAVIDANLIPLLIKVLQTGDYRSKKEAVWAISNATSGGTLEQVQYIVMQGCIKPLVDMLTVKDAKIVRVILDSLVNILRAGAAPDGTNCCADWIEEAGGIDVIEELQQHENEEVYKKALKIIEEFFSEEDDEIPGAMEGGGFGQQHHQAQAQFCF